MSNLYYLRVEQREHYSNHVARITRIVRHRRGLGLGLPGSRARSISGERRQSLSFDLIKENCRLGQRLQMINEQDPVQRVRLAINQHRRRYSQQERSRKQSRRLPISSMLPPVLFRSRF
jgi:hypothetical protein